MLSYREYSATVRHFTILHTYFDTFVLALCSYYRSQPDVVSIPLLALCIFAFSPPYSLCVSAWAYTCPLSYRTQLCDAVGAKLF